MTSVTGSIAGAWLAAGSGDAAAAGGDAAGAGVALDAPGATVADASRGSQRTPTCMPAGRTLRSVADSWNVSYVVDPAVGGAARFRGLTARPSPESVVSSGGSGWLDVPTAPATTFADTRPSLSTIER